MQRISPLLVAMKFMAARLTTAASPFVFAWPGYGAVADGRLALRRARRGHSRPGWSVRQGQRMACKRSRRSANRCAHRG